MRSNRVIGFTSIVNIIANKYPIVFVRANLFVNYTEELMKTFPDKEPFKALRQNEPGKSSGHMEPPHLSKVNKHCKRLRDPNEQYEDLPDLNRIPDSLS